MKTYNTALAGLTVCSLLLTANANAEEVLETTVVTATRSAQDYSDVLASVSVYNRADIERLQAIDMADLLSRAAGVSFNRNGGRGSVTSLSLRGNQTDHTLFLIDGVRIGSATLGSATLSAINLANVERIEIVRGPKSALWGADALGGVVNIITRHSEEAKRVSLSTSYGSNKTTQNTVFAAFNGETSGFDVTANNFNTDGIDNTESTVGAAADEDASRSTSLALNFRHAFSDQVKLKVSYNYNDSETEYDSDCLDSTFFTAVDCFIYSTGTVDALSARLDFKVSDSYQSALVAGRSRDESNNLADNVDLSSTFSGGEFNTEKTELSWLNVFNLGRSELTAGLDYQLDEVTSTTIYDVDSRDNKAAFLQLNSDFDRIDTLLGVRYDDNEQFGDQTTLSLQAGYKLSDTLRVVASYAEGFKPPTFNDLYFPDFGDPSFVPEESENLELALKGEFESTRFYVAVYQNDIDNLIQFNSNTFETDQTAEAEIRGIEFELSTQVAGFDIALNGSVMDPENKVNGLQLRRRAKRAFALDVDRRWQKFGLGVSIVTEGDRFDDPGNFQELSGYELLDLRASYQFNDQLRVEARIENVTDEEYSTAFDFSLGRYQSVGREAFITFVYTPTL